MTTKLVLKTIVLLWRIAKSRVIGLRAMSYAHSGTTNAVLRVNKTDVPNPTAAGSNPAYDTLIDSYTDRLHSIGITNVDFGVSGARVFGGSASQHAAVGHFTRNLVLQPKPIKR